MSGLICYTTNIPICIVQGDTKIITLTFVDDIGDPVDTSGWTAISQIRVGLATDLPPVAEFTSGWVANVLTLTLSSGVSWLLLSTVTAYMWDVKIDDGTSVVTPARGDVSVQGAISKVVV